MTTAVGTRHRSLAWLVLPALVFFTAFGIIPLIGVLALSFTTWDGIGEIVPTGLANWGSVLTDPGLPHALWVTFLVMALSWLVQTPVSILIGVFIAGSQSHAFTKGPILPPPGSTPALDDSGTYAEESLRPADPDFELWDVGHAALAAAAAHLGIAVEELLYARVDVIGGPDDPRLLELELVEPSLGWRQLDPETRALAQREFALGVDSALERLGLGPFSHRRP